MAAEAKRGGGMKTEIDADIMAMDGEDMADEIMTLRDQIKILRETMGKLIIENGRLRMAQDSSWLIWSNEHRAWWGPAQHGYVFSRADAGRYTFQKAMQIVMDANKYQSEKEKPNEAMVPEGAAIAGPRRSNDNL
jgi:hypothetical protein